MKQLRECKTREEVIHRLQKNSGILDKKINEGNVYTGENQEIGNITWRELRKYISNVIRDYMNDRTQLGERMINDDKDEKKDGYEIDKFFEEVNDDINENLKGMDDLDLDLLILELEDELSIKQNFLNEDKYRHTFM